MGKRILIVLLSLFLLSSCDVENLWQRVGIAPKPKLEIETPAIVPVNVTNGKFDVFSLFENDNNLSLNVNLENDFTQNILGIQSKHELNAMVELLLSKAFGNEEIENFLNSGMSETKAQKALRGNVQLLNAIKGSFITVFEGIPTIEITEDTIDKYIKDLKLDNTDEERSRARDVLTGYNNLIKDAKRNIISFITELFAPLENYLHEPIYYYKDFLRIQLTFNIAGALSKAFSETFSTLSFDLADTKDLQAFFSSIVENSLDSCYILVLNLIGNIVSPLAAMDQLASRYGEIIGLPDVAYMVEFVMGERQ